MNNASQAPWWLSVLTAFIAASATLGAVWVTNKYSSRRSNAELSNTRTQFEKQLSTQREQFVTQMEAQRETERRKLVHDTRQALYLEVCEAFNSADLKIAEMWQELNVETEEEDEEWHITPNPVPTMSELYRLRTACLIMASQEVGELVNEIWIEFRDLSAKYHGALQEHAPLDVLEIWKPAVGKFRKTIDLMRRDLGVVE
ncbi:hypothetical protein [Amycolatopsis regifaucium]|uniref:hypothetical protein n=1 Tax=Amycolatopsis regifaucium TaxID=546365 RepID=UPI0011602122|nr:hypothetical protein [Amycolatopsis regifaucium]